VTCCAKNQLEELRAHGHNFGGLDSFLVSANEDALPLLCAEVSSKTCHMHVASAWKLTTCWMHNAQDHDVSKPPEDGAYVYGMFIEGARWDYGSMSLVESHPKVADQLISIVHMLFSLQQPVVNDKRGSGLALSVVLPGRLLFSFTISSLVPAGAVFGGTGDPPVAMRGREAGPLPALRGALVQDDRKARGAGNHGALDQFRPGPADTQQPACQPLDSSWRGILFGIIGVVD
jgi:Dynein heavy chain C-terminal domain